MKYLLLIFLRHLKVDIKCKQCAQSILLDSSVCWNITCEVFSPPHIIYFPKEVNNNKYTDTGCKMTALYHDLSPTLNILLHWEVLGLSLLVWVLLCDPGYKMIKQELLIQKISRCPWYHHLKSIRKSLFLLVNNYLSSPWSGRRHKCCKQKTIGDK